MLADALIDAQLTWLAAVASQSRVSAWICYLRETPLDFALQLKLVKQALA